MKIIHTADVHLHSSYPRRMQALEIITELGRAQNIDLLLIAGDLFDDHHQAELLRGKVRRLFSNLPYKVLAIPGNHDERAFSEESFHGNDFLALTEKPFTIHDFLDCRIVAVPYADGSFAPLAQGLRTATAPDRKNILMLHCTWSLPHYTSQDYGGDDLRYLPVTEENLQGLGYDFILAGHFHTNYRQRRLPCGALFVYPGSPVSISSREQGRRSVNIIDHQGCHQHLLDTWYCHSLDYNLDINNTAAVLDELRREILQHPDNLCELSINISGYIGGNEKELHKMLEGILAGRINTSLDTSYRSAGKIYSDPLFMRFQQCLDQAEVTEHRAEMETMLIDAFSQLLAEGK